MKDYDFVLREICSDDDILLDSPRILNVEDCGLVYRIIVRSVDTYDSLVAYQLRYKRYPSPSWFCNESIFEFVGSAPRLFDI